MIILAFLTLALIGIGIIGIAMAERAAIDDEDDGYTPEFPLPGPIVVHLSVGDRLDKKRPGVDTDIEAMIRQIERQG